MHNLSQMIICPPYIGIYLKLSLHMTKQWSWELLHWLQRIRSSGDVTVEHAKFTKGKGLKSWKGKHILIAPENIASICLGFKSIDSSRDIFVWLGKSRMLSSYYGSTIPTPNSLLHNSKLLIITQSLKVSC